jgi:uncharacterized protein YkwD
MLGLSAACLLVTAVGVTAIRYGGDAPQGLSYADAATGVVATQTSSATPARTPIQNTSHSVAKPAPASSAPLTSQAGQPQAESSNSPRFAVGPKPSASPAAPSPSEASPQRQQPMNPMPGQSNLAYAKAVYQAINEARAGQHLPALAWSSKLQASARQHNAAMAVANRLAHQVGDEPNLGARETAAGVNWTYAAENIGWTTARDRSGALAIEASMFAESPPSDAHRRNILSTSAHAVGVDVLIDSAHGRLWLTEDFSDVG